MSAGGVLRGGMFLCVIPTSDKNYLVVPRSGEKKKLIKTKLIKKKRHGAARGVGGPTDERSQYVVLSL